MKKTTITDKNETYTQLDFNEMKDIIKQIESHVARKNLDFDASSIPTNNGDRSYGTEMLSDVIFPTESHEDFNNQKT